MLTAYHKYIKLIYLIYCNSIYRIGQNILFLLFICLKQHVDLNSILILKLLGRLHIIYMHLRLLHMHAFVVIQNFKKSFIILFCHIF